MKRRTFLASAAAGSTALLAGCSRGDEPQPGDFNSSGGTTTEAEVAETITITDESQFDPMRAEIPVGAAVEWVNEDSNFMSHILKSPAMVAAAPDTFTESGKEWELDVTVLKGDSYKRTFAEPGVYEYYSQRGEPAEGRRSVAGWTDMCGAVIVGDAELSEKLPCEE